MKVYSSLSSTEVNTSTNGSMRLDCIVLLDKFSTQKIKNSIYDLSTYGVDVIHDLKNIDESILESSPVLIVLEDYIKIPGAINDLELFKSIFNLNIAVITRDSLVVNAVKDIAKCYSFNPENLNYDMIYSILYSDVGLASSLEIDETEAIYGGVIEAKEIIDTVDNLDLTENILLNYYISLVELYKNSTNTIDVLVKDKRNLEAQYLSEVNKNKKFIENHAKIIKKIKDSNKSLEEYQAILSYNICDKIPISEYDNRPIIVYIKEFQELIHFNSFIETLFKSVQYHLNLSCKVIRLYDSSVSKILPTLDKKFKLFHNTFDETSLVTSDFIAKYGDYKKILDLLFKNKMGLNVLIIIDSKDTSVPILSSSDIQLYTCRSSSNTELLNLQEDLCIVNNCGDEGFTGMSWDTELDYKSYSEEDRFNRLSSRLVIQRIITSIEEKLGRLK